MKAWVRSVAIVLVLAGAAIPFAAGTVGADTILVPAGSTWKYLDDGTDQGTAWTEPSFQATAWSEGPAELGYGDGDEATVVGYGPDPDHKYITTYFSHEFEVAARGDFACLMLRLVRDDGAVVYLNGVEIGRFNMPEGVIGYLTPAVSTIGSTDESAFQEAYALPAALVAGSNVIAVEIHQVEGTSSDIGFDLELTGLAAMPPLARKVPYLVYSGENTEMDVHWQLTLTDTCTIEWGPDGSYSLGNAQTVEYGTEHQHAYTIGGLEPGTVYYYRVTVEVNQYTGYFRTASPEDEIQLKFFAYGDTRTYPADHDAVAGAMVSRYAADPDFLTFVLSVGDLVSNGDDESAWDTEFFDPSYENIRKMLRHLPYQSAMGNHEGSGVLFTQYFPYPFVAGRYWSFDYGPAHFTVVDQYTSYGPGSAQLAWIEADLAATAKAWKFICLHEPGWSAGGHSNNTNVQNYIEPLCEEYGVAIVFAGHNHYYARAVVNGIQHITTGGGGAPLYDPNPTYPNIVACAKAHHACMVEIEGGSLHLEAVDPEGALLDSLTLTLPGAAADGSGGAVRGPVYSLGRVEPNPFETYTSVPFSVGEQSPVLLEVYDVGGKRVRTLVETVMRPGSHTSVWDGTDDAGRPLPPGIYFFRFHAGGRSMARKAILAK
jgi:hypothetical protein